MEHRSSNIVRPITSLRHSMNIWSIFPEVSKSGPQSLHFFTTLESPIKRHQT